MSQISWEQLGAAEKKKRSYFQPLFGSTDFRHGILWLRCLELYPALPPSSTGSRNPITLPRGTSRQRFLAFLIRSPGTGSDFTSHRNLCVWQAAGPSPPSSTLLHGLPVPVGTEHKGLAAFALLFSEQYCKTHFQLSSSRGEETFTDYSGHLSLPDKPLQNLVI